MSTNARGVAAVTAAAEDILRDQIQKLATQILTAANRRDENHELDSAQ